LAHKSGKVGSPMHQPPSEGLNLLEDSGPVQAYRGTALPLPLLL